MMVFYHQMNHTGNLNLKSGGHQNPAKVCHIPPGSISELSVCPSSRRIVQSKQLMNWVNEENLSGNADFESTDPERQQASTDTLTRKQSNFEKLLFAPEIYHFDLPFWFTI